MNHDLERYRAPQNFCIQAADTVGKKGQPENKLAREQWLIDHSPELDALQNLFYADARRGLLLILQGMDTSGKDGTIRRVFHDVNPLGIRVHAFKSPSEEELSHDYLWRIHHAMPKKGEIVIFNRSHYEDVLITHVRGWIDEAEMNRRLRQINDFERMAVENNILVIKMFLHISKDEQRERLQKRLDNTEKHWKFNLSDLEDRRLWDDFQKQYEYVITATNTDYAPWYIVPADSKSTRNVIVMQILLSHLRSLDMAYPKVDSSNWPKIVE